jgi:hypothetical protein
MLRHCYQGSMSISVSLRRIIFYRTWRWLSFSRRYQLIACRPEAALPFLEAFAKVVIYLDAEQKLFLDQFLGIEAEAVNVGAVTVLEFAILIFGRIESVAAAILFAMNPACVIFSHKDYWFGAEWQSFYVN